MRSPARTSRQALKLEILDTSQGQWVGRWYIEVSGGRYRVFKNQCSLLLWTDLLFPTEDQRFKSNFQSSTPLFIFPMKEIVLWAQANLDGVNVVGTRRPPSSSEALGVEAQHRVSGPRARLDLQPWPLCSCPWAVHLLGFQLLLLPKVKGL